MTDPVDWKQTFFLNLIIQLPCTLTVAVCKRIPANSSSSQMTGGTKTRTLAKTEERVVVVDKGTELVERGRPNDVQRSGSPDGAESGTDDKITNGTRTSTKPSSSRDSNKSRMVALRRITKKVYAAPYKSRMDVKDAFMNELSYPLIFYTVNDYESHDLHLPIWEREYLCVELSVNAPLDPAAASALNHEGAVAAVSIEDDPSPFPIPRGYFKVVLFQGAVPYSSLLDIFQQKGLASQNQRRNRSGGGGGGGGGGFGGGFGGGGGGGERTEYIMMRGPHGKGQCQVAIQDHSNAAGAGAGGGADGGSGSAGSSGFSTSPGRGMTLSDRLRFLGDTVRAGINAVTGATSPTSSSGSLDSLTTTPRKPDSLRCSMTYVNVPWQSIISDLIDHAKSKRNPGSAKQDSGTPASP
ncbi:hypothetical protein DFJ73DRAFT_791461 [Zopfochytrium polystomum]|nr:hypothetical protein DFJ73DRAFT_791461 [Zopfochytrium polystomum]